MTTTQNTAAKNLAEMLARKVAEARANGATEEEAINAVRLLWIEYLQKTDQQEFMPSARLRTLWEG